ncbi:MAG: hypothetical protein KAT48_07140 [Bacteroidales bacterium]|nr:hypothetical protein [Bacteroidales bacterium]
MLIKDVILLENQNRNSIFLYKEGLFCRCYETSAFLFQHYIKSYKIVSKFVKNVNQYIVLLGFPVKNLTEIIQLATKNGIIIVSALPGGNRNNNGGLNNLGNNVNFWSSTENSGSNAWNRKLNYNNDKVNRNNNYKTNGFSVRCLED